MRFHSSLNKEKRVGDNFLTRDAPLKGNGKESPKMRFIAEVEALQQARLNFVTGLIPRMGSSSAFGAGGA